MPELHLARTAERDAVRRAEQYFLGGLAVDLHLANRLQKVAFSVALQGCVVPRKVGTTVRYALSDPQVTRLLAVAREIFNNHFVGRQSMLKALQREGRR